MNLDEAFESLEEAQEKARRKKELALSRIPIKVDERHGLFHFEGYVARTRVITCARCSETRHECLGIFVREQHEQGGFRYIVAKTWPTEGEKRHEILRITEPYCYSCAQEFGFTKFEDHGECAFSPLFKQFDEGQVSSSGTNRIIPKSVQEVLQKMAERPMTKANLDADEMLDELLKDL